MHSIRRVMKEFGLVIECASRALRLTHILHFDPMFVINGQINQLLWVGRCNLDGSFEMKFHPLSFETALHLSCLNIAIQATSILYIYIYYRSQHLFRAKMANIRSNAHIQMHYLMRFAHKNAL